MVRGEDCPLCAELASKEAINEYGYTVADLTRSRLRLAANQWVPDYCILISSVHVSEPNELEEPDRVAYFDDLMLVGQAIERVYAPLKLNFQLLGNAVPHLLSHITPRYYRDPAPHRPLDPDLGQRHLPPEEVAERIATIRAALGSACN